jgi:hypothetical protein
MRIDARDFEDTVTNILKQLNKLNSDIIFHYYIECKATSKYKTAIDINTSMIHTTLFSSFDEMSFGDVENEVKTSFPYYYKMMRLYAHLCAIIDLDKKSFQSSFSNVVDSIVLNEYNPSVLIADDIRTIDYSQCDLESDDMSYFNQELKVLMRNANTLNKDFKKYGVNQTAFLTECDMNDYKYLTVEEPPTELDSEWVAGPGLEKRLQDAAIKELQDEIDNSFATTKIIPASNTSFAKVDVNHDRNLALKKIGDLYACGTFSKKTAQKLMYDIVFNYKIPSLCDDNSYRNCAINHEEAKKILYDRNMLEKFEEIQRNHDKYFNEIMNKNE